MHGQAVAAIKPDIAALPGIKCNEIVAATHYPGSTRDLVKELERNIVGEGVETVIAIHQSRKTFHDDIEERVERGKRRVVTFGHAILPKSLTRMCAPVRRTASMAAA
jgi:hypothetical protein